MTQEEGKKTIWANRTGESYSEALKTIAALMMDHGQTAADDYLITVGFEKAAGWYVLENGNLKWKYPENGENIHAEVIVQDINDLRFIPYLNISYELLDKDKKVVASKKEFRFIWHPFAFHYAEDFKIPGAGEYFTKVSIKIPDFRRHDSLRGKKYQSEVNVELGPFDLKPGVKPIGPE